MKASSTRFQRIRSRAFTLVELLVATAILTMLLAMLLTVTNHVGSTLTRSSARLEAFSTGRTGFDIVTQNLSRATLNTYWDYYNSSGYRRNTTIATGNGTYTSFVPATYGRASDLQFLIQQSTQQNATNGYYGQELYFAAPLASATTYGEQSTQGLLNACGYFVRYGTNLNYRPVMISATSTKFESYRYRLFEALQPTEYFQYFTPGSGGLPPSWVAPILSNSNNIANNPNMTTYGGAGHLAAEPLANNVIAFIVWPLDPQDLSTSGTELAMSGTGYAYDSQYPFDISGYTPTTSGTFTASSFPITFCQLPPTVQVTMVLIDEPSAVRLCTSATPPSVIENALQGKFTQVANYETDLYGGGAAAGVTGTLGLIKYLDVNYHINCQVLNTKVVLRESKWSK